jgi:phosphoglycerol transferase
MRIAILNSLPNLPVSAEAEFILRALKACRALGWDAHEVVTSDDIMRLSPECVLVTHEASPKLTPFPTVGALWGPCTFHAEDPVRRKAILSYDAWLSGSEEISLWLEDFLIGQGKRPLIHTGPFLPSAPDFGPADDLPADLAMIYVGLHWDGNRHGTIFSRLAERLPMNIYGPAERWEHVGARYRGAVPFDGESVIKAIRRSGVALCLNKAAHRDFDCPSMRLFEAAAAGALIISDDFGFPRQWFRNSVLYVDADLPPRLVVEQVVAHFHWAQADRQAANRLAKRSNELFRSQLTLERMLEPLPELVDRARKRTTMVTPCRPGRSAPTVEYVVRIGARSAEVVDRALRSLVGQNYPALAVTLVQFHPVEGIEGLMVRHRARFQWLRRVIVPNTGKRSTAWWAGLRSIQADFFAFLDDDDELHPNHVTSIMVHFERHPDCGFVYSGVIRAEVDPGHFVQAPNFEGPGGKTIEETRELLFLDPPDLARLARFENYITSNSWICRTSALRGEIPEDPKVEYTEDVYFYLWLSARAKFGFTGLPTAVWNWRSTARDNSMLSVADAAFATGKKRLTERLQDATRYAKVSIEREPDHCRAYLDVQRDLI